MSSDLKRTAAFAANPQGDDFIKHLNDVVRSGEAQARPDNLPPIPIFLVVGAPRSGTTVLMQFLQSIGLAVPTNIAARFPQNPYFAGLLQRLLSDPALNYRDELTSAMTEEFASDYGKTRGILSPHEFSYFFRRFFPTQVGHKMSGDELTDCRTSEFVDEITAFGHAAEGAAAVKALLVQYNLDLFRDFGNVYFIHTLRDTAANAYSIYRHRQIVADDPDEWISVRPPEYSRLKDAPVADQVVGQVHFTNRAVSSQLSTMPQDRVITLGHSEFCERPEALYDRLAAIISASGLPDLAPYSGPENFTESGYDAADTLMAELSAALARIAAS